MPNDIPQVDFNKCYVSHDHSNKSECKYVVGYAVSDEEQEKINERFKEAQMLEARIKEVKEQKKFHKYSERLGKGDDTEQIDMVNHPPHYTSHPSGIECIEIVRHHNFPIGSAIKYLWRQGLKDTPTVTEDLEKAVWYLQDEIERLKGEEIRQEKHH